ncbi:MAG: hypothetical protein WEA24_10325 [Gemmatimonadota bacterium]
MSGIMPAFFDRVEAVIREIVVALDEAGKSGAGHGGGGTSMEGDGHRRLK